MNHQEVLYSHLQQAVIQDICIPVILDAELADENSWINSKPSVYWYTFLALVCQSIRKLSNACFVFSLFVTHSRFSTLLSVLIQFMWLTQDFFSGFLIKVSAIRRWMVIFLWRRSLYKHTLKYQFHILPLSNFSSQVLLNFNDFTLPILLTWYNHSYPSTGFHSSIKKILFLLSELKPRTA